MNIVINAFSAKLGGGQTYLKQLLARLPSDLEQITLFAPQSLALPGDPRITRPTVRWPVDNPVLRAIWERFMLSAILRKAEADMLFCPGGVVATRVPRGCKTVTMFRNMIPFTPELVKAMPWGLQRLRNIILKRVMLRSMAKADLTIFISNYARSVVEAIGPVRNGVTIFHGISPEFRNAGQSVERPEGAPDRPYLLYVSRFDIYKHHREVVLALAALPPEQRKMFPLVLIGEDDLPEAQVVVRMISELGLAENVRIMGALPYGDLPKWYHHAKLSIFASSCENCPNILLEALGAGRPVLSSDIMPMPEFAGDILYFSPRQPETLTAAILCILTDPPAETRVAHAATEAAARYDWANTAEETWAALRNMADG